MKNSIKIIFDENDGVAQMRTLLKNGITYYQVNRLLEQGVVVKLKHGVYKWKTDNENEWADIIHLVPNGILCLLTSALHHELTTFVSSEYHIAIPKKMKLVLPDYPPIKLYYWDSKAFRLGIIETVIQETPVKMYNIEKTVCDIVRLRNKIGIDIAKEVLKNYLKHPNCDMPKLNEYARQLRISSILNNFLNILL